MENSLSTYEPHGCVIVYSVVNRSSFRQAEDIVKYLWRENVTKEKAVILVGNKADLARSRVIPSAEGKALAKSIDAKFIETSSGIQHNVDELLVGILKQVSKMPGWHSLSILYWSKPFYMNTIIFFLLLFWLLSVSIACEWVRERVCAYIALNYMFIGCAHKIQIASYLHSFRAQPQY